MTNLNFFDVKIKTFFSRFDFDQNYRIEEEDFSTWSKKLVTLGNLNSIQEKNLKTTTDLIWKTYFLPADLDNDGSVQELELIAYMKMALNDQHKLAIIDMTLGLIFDAIDYNQDEQISNEEYSNFLQSLGVLDKQFVDYLFDKMDINHDGLLNRMEFIHFGKQFFLCDDESNPSKLFFGPLVHKLN